MTMTRGVFATFLVVALATGCSDDDAGTSPPDTTEATDVGGSDAAPDAGTADDDAAEGDVADDDATDIPTGPYADCYPEFVSELGIDYAAQGATIGGHCSGTNQQDIEGVERVVFLGDSITVGVGAVDAPGYREQVTSTLRAEWGEDLVVDDCSREIGRAHV